MKKYLFRHYQLPLYFSCFIIIQLMSGCVVAELGFEAGMAGELAETEVAAEAMIGADDVAILRNGLAEDAAGNVRIINPESVNSILRKVRLERISGELPKLYIEGKLKPFAEVYSQEGKLRMLGSGRFYSANNNIFSVENEFVDIKADASNYSNVVGRVTHGQLLVKLLERDGWYQVRFFQNSIVKIGWINASNILPLVIGAQGNNAAISDSTDNTSYPPYPGKIQIESDLLGKKMPGWNFDYLAEFQDLQIPLQSIENNYLSLTIVLRVKDLKTMEMFDSKIVVQYYRLGDKWVFSNFAQRYILKVRFIESNPSSRNMGLHYYQPAWQNSSTVNIRPGGGSSQSREFARPPLIPNTSYYIITTYISGNYSFPSNTMVSTQISGQFTVQQNVSCVVNRNGVIHGDIILTKNSTLTNYGIITGLIYNYGARIINYNRSEQLRIVNYAIPETRTRIAPPPAPSRIVANPYRRTY